MRGAQLKSKQQLAEQDDADLAELMNEVRRRKLEVVYVLRLAQTTGAVTYAELDTATPSERRNAARAVLEGQSDAPAV